MVRYVPRPFSGTLILADVPQQHILYVSLTGGVWLVASLTSLTVLSALVSGGAYLLGVFSPMASATPYSTIIYTATITNSGGGLEALCTPVNVVVRFPDGTTSTYGLGSGVSNMGLGVYRLVYTSKMPGIHWETWTVTSGDGISVASFQHDTAVNY